MTLSAGTRLGPYEIGDPLGAGGMGEVYRARDTRLGREVAVKVLPEGFVRDRQRLARFEQEAKILASLNHPNIAAIYELEAEDEDAFLVLELVPGESLAQRLSAGPLPLDETLEIARQIAAGLEAAHEAGVIHRDLKPGNVAMTPAGEVKILDFGLAKLARPAGHPAELGAGGSGGGPDDPTLTQAATVAGSLLGTAAYMSPEQARGKPVDRRADIWAFGCVLYECLTGRRAFAGETLSDTLAAILEREPDWAVLPPATPAAIRELLHRCLRKEARRRLRDIGDARVSLEEISAGGDRSLGPVSAPGERSRWRWLAAGLLVGAALAAGWFLLARRPPAPRPAVHLSLSLPPGDRLAVHVPAGPQPALALAPDGKSLAYAAWRGEVTKLFLRSLADPEVREVPGTEGAYAPFWSPDGESLGYFTKNALMRVAVRGGAPETICAAAPEPMGASWGPEGFIVFTDHGRSGLLMVAAAGGDPHPLSVPDAAAGELSHRWPQVLPDGSGVLFARFPGAAGAEGDLAVVSIDGGEPRVVLKGATFGRYFASGHLVYALQGSLLAIPFELERREVTGKAAPVLPAVWTHPNGLAQVAFSGGGVLAYLPPGTARSRRLIWVDRAGSTQNFDAEPVGPGSFSISPDGQRLALATAASEDDEEVWVQDLERGGRLRLTTGADEEYYPIWTPDGSRIVFVSERDGPPSVFAIAADGSASEEPLPVRDPQEEGPSAQFAYSFSPDGRYLAYLNHVRDTGYDLWLLEVATGRRIPFLRSPHDESHPMISPDGRWVAYVSDETGRREVFVTTFPRAGGRWRISTDGGDEPRWSPDGGELFYRAGEDMMAVEIAGGDPSRAAAPAAVLFSGDYAPGGTNPGFPRYEVSPDGERFLMIEETGAGGPPPELRIVLDWFAAWRQEASGAGGR